MHIALYKPDIPQNTGAIIRLSACLNLKIHIIEPCGFDLNDSRFKRVVMDYIGFSKVFRYADYNMFIKKNQKFRIILMTTKAKKNYYNFKFKAKDTLLFGRESAGVPKSVHDNSFKSLKIPLKNKARSLNVGMAAAITLVEALKQNSIL